jgi:ribose transport system substrate-binding protein
VRAFKISVVALPVVLLTSGAFAAGETIAIFTKNQSNPYFQTVRVGADAAAKAMNAKTIHYIPTKPDSIPEQLSQIEDVIVKKPDAVVLIPVDYKAIVPGIEQINRAFVGADDYSIALETGRHLLKAMGGTGNVVILEGVKGSLTNADRVRGFNDALKEFKDVKLLASQPGNYQRMQGLQVMENLMQSYRTIGGVMAANDAMAVGAVEALEGANRQSLVIGIAGSKEAVDAIKAGKLLASGDFNGFLQGCIGTMIALRALRNEPIVDEIVLAPKVVEKSNYQAYDVPVENRTCPTWEEASRMARPAK